MLFRVEVDLAIKRPPAAHETVSVTLDERTYRDAHMTAIAMAMVFHPSTVMAVASRADLIMDDVFPREWWNSEDVEA